MATILWTKSRLSQEFLPHLVGVQHRFLEVIDIKNRKVAPFEVKNSAVIFTSSNAVKSLFENGFSVSDLSKSPIYVVGKHTENTLLQYGITGVKVEKNAETLAQTLIREAEANKFIHFCGNLVLDTLQTVLSKHQLSYTPICVYDTELLYPYIEGEYDALVFFSPSGVRSFVKHNALEGKKLFSIGKTTENELKKYTTQDVICSEANTLSNLVEKIKSVQWG